MARSIQHKRHISLFVTTGRTNRIAPLGMRNRLFENDLLGCEVTGGSKCRICNHLQGFYTPLSEQPLLSTCTFSCSTCWRELIGCLTGHQPTKTTKRHPKKLTIFPTSSLSPQPSDPRLPSLSLSCELHSLSLTNFSSLSITSMSELGACI